MIIKLQGGLGNQMFQYAFSKAIEKHYKKKVLLDKEILLDRTFIPNQYFVFRDFDLDIFKIDTSFSKPGAEETFRHQKYSNYLLSGFTRKAYFKEEHLYFNPAVFNVQGDTYFDGYWQSYRYFENVKDELRQDFSLPVAVNSVGLYKEIKNNDNAVCINVRRADFLVNAVHGSHSMEYFNTAIEIICAQISSPSFYIFSDDVEWCTNNFALNYPTTIVSYEHKGNKFGNYLKLLSACHHFIIPNSSFAWWGVWLSNQQNKIVIAPRAWYGEKKLNDQTIDLIPDNWIRI